MIDTFVRTVSFVRRAISIQHQTKLYPIERIFPSGSLRGAVLCQNYICLLNGGRHRCLLMSSTSPTSVLLPFFHGNVIRRRPKIVLAMQREYPNLPSQRSPDLPQRVRVGPKTGTLKTPTKRIVVQRGTGTLKTTGRATRKTAQRIVVRRGTGTLKTPTRRTRRRRRRTLTLTTHQKIGMVQGRMETLPLAQRTLKTNPRRCTHQARSPNRVRDLSERRKGREEGEPQKKTGERKGGSSGR